MMRRRRIASRNHSTQLPEPCDVTVVTPILVQSAYQLVLLLVLLFKGEQLFGVRSGGDEPCFPEYCADGVGRKACNEDCDPEHKDHTHEEVDRNSISARRRNEADASAKSIFSAKSSPTSTAELQAAREREKPEGSKNRPEQK